MLYLYGASGTTYLYIHLNNDLTAKRDNRGRCVPGVAYATGLKNGAQVKAGQQIGYNGDSGDAEGIYHLHFEVHPNDGARREPVPVPERRPTRLLFALPPSSATRSRSGLRGHARVGAATACSSSRVDRRCASGPAARGRPSPAASVELAVPRERARSTARVAAQIVGAHATHVVSSAARRSRPRRVHACPPRPTFARSHAGAPSALAVDRSIPRPRRAAPGQACRPRP